MGPPSLELSASSEASFSSSWRGRRGSDRVSRRDQPGSPARQGEGRCQGVGRAGLGDSSARGGTGPGTTSRICCRRSSRLWRLSSSSFSFSSLEMSSAAKVAGSTGVISLGRRWVLYGAGGGKTRGMFSGASTRHPPELPGPSSHGLGHGYSHSHSHSCTGRRAESGGCGAQAARELYAPAPRPHGEPRSPPAFAVGRSSWSHSEGPRLFSL